MKRVKDITLYSTLCFTLVMMLFCILLTPSSDISDASGDAALALNFADYAFTVLLYSVCVGLSFLLFDIKINKVLNRTLHIILNYVLMVIFLSLLVREGVDLTKMVFVCTFVFIVVYPAAMVICFWLRKLDKMLQSRKK